MRLISWMILVCAMLSAGCTRHVSEGAGYFLFHPKEETVDELIAKDKEFAKEIARHQMQCRKDVGCKKD